MPMNRIDVAGLSYKYLVGPYTVGIICKNGRKHVASIEEVHGDGKLADTRTADGELLDRVSPTEVAAYILNNKIR